jgi:iron(III) transport system permease protein
MALVLCVVSLLVLVGERRARYSVRRSAAPRARSSDPLERVGLRQWRYVALAYVSLVSFASLVLPLGVLVWWIIDRGDAASWSELASGAAEAAYGSLVTSVLAALAAVAISLPVAWLAARRPTRATASAELLVYVGYALPGIVAALGLVAFSVTSAAWAYQTLGLLVAAYVIRFMPQALGASRTALERIDPVLEDAARGVGLSRIGVLRKVTAPLAAPGISAGAALVLLTAMKELPATLVLRPTGFTTLATEIWTQTAVTNYAAAAVPALVLVAVSAVPLWLLVLGPQVRAATGQPVGRAAAPRRDGSPPAHLVQAPPSP